MVLISSLVCIVLGVLLPFGAVAQSHAVSSTSLGSTLDGLIPRPRSAIPLEGSYILRPGNRIVCRDTAEALRDIAGFLASRLHGASGFDFQVVTNSGPGLNGDISLSLRDTLLGEEGYQLLVAPDSVALSAGSPAGLFRGIQTLRQLLPAAIEMNTPQPGPWPIPCAVIRDWPRFPWRGVMLDVARHFFGVDQVKRTIDLAAYYKINRLHLHLSDDQGWRLMILSWPRLAAYGGSTEVGGGPGGCFTQDDYRQIVAYAAERYIMVVPEIDMPGHTNAALASYPELNCNGIAPPLYTGTNVGFSALCTAKETTFTIISAVLKEIAALTPGPYIHIGGDEASVTSPGEYNAFVARVESLLTSQGKRMIGWEEIARAPLSPSSIAQHWAGNLAQQAVQRGMKVIMSPSSRAYMDMKYTSASPLGQTWAGYIEVDRAYSWDPATEVAGVGESSLLGLEAPLWTETIQTMSDIEYMMYPRVPGYGEIGWSDQAGRDWNEYRLRLGTHGPRLSAQGVNYYQSPLIPWSSPPSAVRSARSDQPASAFTLEQNYPNPFNPWTTIRYALPRRSHVTLTVFNTLGQKVADLINGEVETGYHEVQFDAGNFASGVYFCRMKADGFVQTKPMTLAR